MITETAEKIIRLAAAYVATGTPVERVCIVLPSGVSRASHDADIRAAGLERACVAAPCTEAQRREIIAALARVDGLDVVY